MNVNSTEHLTVLRDSKDHDCQISKDEKFVKVKIHMASRWWGNLNGEPQLKTCGGQDGGQARAAFPSRAQKTCKSEVQSEN